MSSPKFEQLAAKVTKHLNLAYEVEPTDVRFEFNLQAAQAQALLGIAEQLDDLVEILRATGDRGPS